MNKDSLFIYSPALLNYHFHDEHPFNQKRLELTLSLIRELGLIDESQIQPPRMATDEELTLIHEPYYIEAVKKAGEMSGSFLGLPYGLGTEDVPIFPGMHEASALSVGGALVAADYVMEKPGRHALHLGGGLHHAFRGRASGFCVYNDCSVAIAYVRKKYRARVLYVDTDAHHGDGVQWAFYQDSDVMTLSFHETGKYLFPGTGNIYERGEGDGYGLSLNVPLEPFTEDDSYLEAYERVIEKAIRFFKPDLLFTQNGADAHRYDPLTHLSVSTRIYREIPKIAHRLAHEYTNGRWIAVGGGGYDIWRVVPRAWTYLWAEMNHHPLLDEKLPEAWIHRWQKEAPVPLPNRMLDPSFPPIPRRKEIMEKNRLTVERVLSYL
ncbi:acetoin utilization protein AcuC [Thermicanus aegyptius]|uniref:acetoin utilization protein AcuC n=1 Tax=Thermicanus aegyptius TaxID=94009 RepID=UPI00041E54EB|nr:acetoin utilization protein AcuC [Thermicanus aegyptius]MBE3554093.1 acetoin utilization protein AcuC [Thermicanus sp.]